MRAGRLRHSRGCTALHQRTQSASLLGSVCSFQAWPPVQIHVVAGRDDRFFPVEFQQRLARDRMGLELGVLPGGHLIALARPAELAEYLLTQINVRG